MPRAVGTKDYTGLTTGLITEASDINFPDGATSDELNFLLDSAGIKRVKRKGYDNVQSLTYAMTTTDVPADVRYGGTEYWQDANVFVSTFYDSINLHIQILDGDDFSVKGSTSYGTNVPNGGEVSMASQGNFFVIAAGESSVHTVLEYRADVSSVVVKLFQLFRRDFTLVDDQLALTERPSVLSDNHEYNLLNSDWYAERKDSVGTFVDPIQEFFTESGNTEYPSNSDIAKLGMKADGSGNEVFSRDTLRELPIGNTESPRGHFVYSLVDTNRDARRLTPSNDGAPSSTITTTLTTINL